MSSVYLLQQETSLAETMVIILTSWSVYQGAGLRITTSVSILCNQSSSISAVTLHASRSFPLCYAAAELPGHFSTPSTSHSGVSLRRFTQGHYAEVLAATLAWFSLDFFAGKGFIAGGWVQRIYST
jgi:hypothetical protein